MDKSSRRQAIRDFKERASVAGIFAIRCAATGEVWVGASPTLEAARTRHWFGLRSGSHANKAMQAAWNAHGEAGLSFEELERIDDESLTPMGRADRLKARERHWLETLGARKAAV